MIVHSRAAALAGAIALAAATPGVARAEPETAASAHWAAVDLVVGRIDPGGDPFTLIALATRGGMLVTPLLGFGLRAGIVHARSDAESATALANLTGDVHVVMWRGFGRWRPRVFATGSVSAPTAGGGIASEVATTYWLREPGFTHPDATSVRGAVTAAVASEHVDGEVDAEVQHLFAGDDPLAGTRVGVRGRVAWKPATRLGLFAAVSTVWLPDASIDDRFLHWIDAGLSIHGEDGGQVRFSFYLPVDVTTRDDLGLIGGQITFAGAL